MSLQRDSEIDNKFNAAVRVVRGLPKSGAFEADRDTMLRFYGLYKQAVFGDNRTNKPFLDFVGRYKWDAWFKLMGMPSDVAKNLYADELKKLILHYALNANVDEANLNGSEEFYSRVAPDYLKLLLGDDFERIRPYIPEEHLRALEPQDMSTSSHMNSNNFDEYVEIAGTVDSDSSGENTNFGAMRSAGNTRLVQYRIALGELQRFHPLVSETVEMLQRMYNLDGLEKGMKLVGILTDKVDKKKTFLTSLEWAVIFFWPMVVCFIFRWYYIKKR